jgi:hypothetical protein
MSPLLAYFTSGASTPEVLRTLRSREATATGLVKGSQSFGSRLPQLQRRSARDRGARVQAYRAPGPEVVI